MDRDRETIDMSDDYMLLRELLDDVNHPLVTIGRLALETGLGTSTLYRYAAGGATIPSIVWRALWRLTGDHRITELITAGSEAMVVKLPSVDFVADEAGVRQMLEVRETQIACERAILEIIKDGKIDSDDRNMIAVYKKDFPAMIEAQWQIYKAITERGNG